MCACVDRCYTMIPVSIFPKHAQHLKKLETQLFSSQWGGVADAWCHSFGAWLQICRPLEPGGYNLEGKHHGIRTRFGNLTNVQAGAGIEHNFRDIPIKWTNGFFRFKLGPKTRHGIGNSHFDACSTIGDLATTVGIYEAEILFSSLKDPATNSGFSLGFPHVKK